MKKTIAILALIFTVNFGYSQTKIKQDSTGNYVMAVKEKKLVSTGKTFTDGKGQSYPVYISDNGKLFVVRVSKSGNEYREYIKIY